MDISQFQKQFVDKTEDRKPSSLQKDESLTITPSKQILQEQEEQKSNSQINTNPQSMHSQIRTDEESKIVDKQEETKFDSKNSRQSVHNGNKSNLNASFASNRTQGGSNQNQQGNKQIDTKKLTQKEIQKLSENLLMQATLDDANRTKGKYKYAVYNGNFPQTIKCAMQLREEWEEITAQNDQIPKMDFVYKPFNFITRSGFEAMEKRVRERPNRPLIYPHFENIRVITTKTGLTRTLRQYYQLLPEAQKCNYTIDDTMPMSFITSNQFMEDVEFTQCKRLIQKIEKGYVNHDKMLSKHMEQNYWIVKPSNLNQGRGIELVSSYNQLINIMSSASVDQNWVIQKYIEKPLLYQKRKFDIRVLSLVNNDLELFAYKDCYVRTSSNIYDTTTKNKLVHLTNNCFQAKANSFGKFEQGNQLSFEKFLEYLKGYFAETYSVPVDFDIDELYLRMKDIMIDCHLAGMPQYNPNQRKEHCFEVLGFDFIIDEDLRVWLLEVNTCPYLGVKNDGMPDFIHNFLDETFVMTVDKCYATNYKYEKEHRYELLYSKQQQVNLRRSYKTELYPSPILRNAIFQDDEQLKEQIRQKQIEMDASQFDKRYGGQSQTSTKKMMEKRKQESFRNQQLIYKSILQKNHGNSPHHSGVSSHPQSQNASINRSKSAIQKKLSTTSNIDQVKETAPPTLFQNQPSNTSQKPSVQINKPSTKMPTIEEKPSLTASSTNNTHQTIQGPPTKHSTTLRVKSQIAQVTSSQSHSDYVHNQRDQSSKQAHFRMGSSSTGFNKDSNTTQASTQAHFFHNSQSTRHNGANGQVKQVQSLRGSTSVANATLLKVGNKNGGKNQVISSQGGGEIEKSVILSKQQELENGRQSVQGGHSTKMTLTKDQHSTITPVNTCMQSQKNVSQVLIRKADNEQQTNLKNQNQHYTRIQRILKARTLMDQTREALLSNDNIDTKKKEFNKIFNNVYHILNDSQLNNCGSAQQPQNQVQNAQQIQNQHGNPSQQQSQQSNKEIQQALGSLKMMVQSHYILYFSDKQLLGKLLDLMSSQSTSLSTKEQLLAIIVLISKHHSTRMCLLAKKLFWRIQSYSLQSLPYYQMSKSVSDGQAESNALANLQMLQGQCTSQKLASLYLDLMFNLCSLNNQKFYIPGETRELEKMRRKSIVNGSVIVAKIIQQKSQPQNLDSGVSAKIESFASNVSKRVDQELLGYLSLQDQQLVVYTLSIYLQIQQQQERGLNITENLKQVDLSKTKENLINKENILKKILEADDQKREDSQDKFENSNQKTTQEQDSDLIKQLHAKNNDHQQDTDLDAFINQSKFQALKYQVESLNLNRPIKSRYPQHLFQEFHSIVNFDLLVKEFNILEDKQKAEQSLQNKQQQLQNLQNLTQAQIQGTVMQNASNANSNIIQQTGSNIMITNNNSQGPAPITKAQSHTQSSTGQHLSDLTIVPHFMHQRKHMSHNKNQGVPNHSQYGNTHHPYHNKRSVNNYEHVSSLPPGHRSGEQPDEQHLQHLLTQTFTKNKQRSPRGVSYSNMQRNYQQNTTSNSLSTSQTNLLSSYTQGTTQHPTHSTRKQGTSQPSMAVTESSTKHKSNNTPTADILLKQTQGPKRGTGQVVSPKNNEQAATIATSGDAKTDLNSHHSDNKSKKDKLTQEFVKQYLQKRPSQSEQSLQVPINTGATSSSQKHI